MKTGDGTHFSHIRRGTGASLVPNPYPGGTSGQLTTTNGVSAGAVHYFELGGMNNQVTATMIRWTDATSSATIVLETTNLSPADAAITSVNASEWAVEPVVITGPTGVAAGSFMLHFSNNAARRNRLKVTVAANTQLEIHSHGMH